jgi:hypothetical protein
MAEIAEQMDKPKPLGLDKPQTEKTKRMAKGQQVYHLPQVRRG